MRYTILVTLFISTVLLNGCASRSISDTLDKANYVDSTGS